MTEKLSTLEQRLALLMEMPTFSNNQPACQKAVESLGEELRSLGLYVEITLGDHPYLVATTQGTKKPELMLVAHLDVVPETNGAQCKLVIDNDKLTGRGVFDMKFAAACYLELVHELAEAGTLHSYGFGIVFTTDEEIGGEHGAGELLKQGWSANLAFIPDGGENWQVESAAKGILTLELSARGRSAHSSRPWEGDNVLSRLVTLLSDIQRTYPYTDQDSLTLSVNQLTGGQAINQIADSAHAIVDMRAFSTTELESAESYIRQAAQVVSIEISTLTTGRPIEIDLNNELVQTALATLEDFRGIPPEYTKSFGATDGRWFSLHDIPTLIFRPTGGGIHGPSEWLLREDLPKFYDILRQLTEDIAFTEVDKTAVQAQTALV